MSLHNEDEPPPNSADLDGWRRSVEECRFVKYPLEAVVAALQDLGLNSDKDVVNALALHVSDVLLRILHGLVGKNRPNQGQDIIDDVHGRLISAVLARDSPDGKGLREAFIPRVQFRAADALRKDGLRRKRECSVEDLDAAFDPKQADDTNQSREIEGRAYVEEVLSRITDDRKRRVFRMHMDGIPLKSTRTTSIEKELGVSSKTAGRWIEEIQAQLRNIAGEQT